MLSSMASQKAMRTQVFYRWVDRLFTCLVHGAGIFVLVLLFAIVVSLLYGSLSSLNTFGVAFLWGRDWDVVGDQFGALSPIVGTLLTSGIALVIAIPVSLGIALFLTEWSPTYVRAPLGVLVELLAAIPSIIYGMWGLFVFMPFFMQYIQPFIVSLFSGVPILQDLFAGPSLGLGIFTAGLILSIMILPFITAVMRDVFRLVPPLLKESAYGLGSTTWEVVWYVILPYTRNGVTGGIILGLGRALGETMAVTFVIGNAHQLSWSLFAPGNSIASTLALEFTEATSPLHISSLIELGLILFLITSLVLTISRLLLLQVAKREG